MFGVVAKLSVAPTNSSSVNPRTAPDMPPSSAQIISRSVVFFNQHCSNYYIFVTCIYITISECFIMIIKINSDYINLNHIQPVF